MKKYTKNPDWHYNNYLHALQSRYGRNETRGDLLKSVGKKMFGGRFRGVYPADLVPRLKNHQYAIVNLDSSGKPGSHWVGVIKHDNKSLVYDSFGRKTARILPQLIGKGRRIVDTDYDPEQMMHEENCGHRCLAWMQVYHKHGYNAAKSI